MNYKENPKTKGSGILCAIPQKGICPNKCEDCFFQSGRSYLEPLGENLPNMPRIGQTHHRLVRVNDGNDSNVGFSSVLYATKKYDMKFYNTAVNDLAWFTDPVVLTVNPGPKTDCEFHKVEPVPEYLMFVRFRTNTWNIALLDKAIEYYSERDVPIVLTFMAYFTAAIPPEHAKNYMHRKRTLNEYWAITTEAWEKVMFPHRYNKWVSSCGKIEGEKGTTACRHCGNCLREYFATMELLRPRR